MGRTDDIVELQKMLKLKTRIITDLRAEIKRLRDNLEFLKDKYK